MTMKVVEVSSYGEADELNVAEWPDPVASGGKVRVRTSAIPVNPADLWTRKGAMAERTPNATLPIILGWEFAGELLDAAPGFEVGARVVGMFPWFAVGDGTGTYAEIVLAEPSWLANLPAGADEVEASTIAMNAQTAQQALAIAAPKKGQTLLVTGASGAVGGFAVQLAAAEGVHVIAVASKGDEDYVRDLGATEVIGRDDLAATLAERYPDGVDSVLDAAAAGPDTIRYVRDGGTFAAVTDPAQPGPERGIDPATVHTQPDPAGLADLIDLWVGGKLRTRIAGVRPLSAAADAQRQLEAGGVRGKLVLTV
jgi:NADPH:quinone reductase